MKFNTLHILNIQSNFTTCYKSINELCLNCLSAVMFELLTSLTGISGLLQGCPNNSDTNLLQQHCHKVDNTRH